MIALTLCSYAFDVDSKTQAFHNRRVFAYVDAGVADGVQLDNKGNVYAGSGDGVHVSAQLLVWNHYGFLVTEVYGDRSGVRRAHCWASSSSAPPLPI